MEDLRKFFNRLRRYNLKLNPANCALGVPVGKLLGFIVSRRGIELDPSKVKAIQELPPPKNKKEKPIPTSKLAKWQILLSEFDIVYATQKAIKGQALADRLAENPELRKRFTKIEFQHVPRVQNEFADALATLSSMIQHPDKNFIDPIPVKIYDQPAYCAHIHADMIKVPPNELTATSSPWLFVVWGMDVIGPIEPSASNKHRFILVAIDYFTKWVEATSYKAVTKKVVADFVRNCIVCWFGIPESIITDNGSNLNSDLMKAMCETFKIKHKNSIAYRPQMNGAVEVANKISRRY
ncbi:uncharacterized protein [Nicotiana sylvestris]|uniref:uncharacterized protein n=1 Tax=Nicotiana sylvestris TaxID=4096 RepID=UPI00388C9AC8